jgi:hypothetical protein
MALNTFLSLLFVVSERLITTTINNLHLFNFSRVLMMEVDPFTLIKKQNNNKSLVYRPLIATNAYLRPT